MRNADVGLKPFLGGSDGTRTRDLPLRYDGHATDDSTAIERSLMGPYRAPATVEGAGNGAFGVLWRHLRLLELFPIFARRWGPSAPTPATASGHAPPPVGRLVTDPGVAVGVTTADSFAGACRRLQHRSRYVFCRAAASRPGASGVPFATVTQLWRAWKTRGPGRL
jgi:hypothetical protein